MLKLHPRTHALPVWRLLRFTPIRLALAGLATGVILLTAYVAVLPRGSTVAAPILGGSNRSAPAVTVKWSDNGPFLVRLVDLASGATLSQLTTSHGVSITLRGSSNQILVTQLDGRGHPSLQIFSSRDLSAQSTSIALTDRVSYLSYDNLLHLSLNDRFLYYQTMAIDADCLGGGDVCADYGIGVVDLDDLAAGVKLASVGKRCGLASFAPVGETEMLSACTDGRIYRTDPSGAIQPDGVASASAFGEPATLWLAGVFAIDDAQVGAVLSDGTVEVVGSGPLSGTRRRILPEGASVFPTGTQLLATDDSVLVAFRSSPTDSVAVGLAAIDTTTLESTVIDPRTDFTGLGLLSGNIYLLDSSGRFMRLVPGGRPTPANLGGIGEGWALVSSR